MSDLRKRKANASSNSADVKGSPKSPDVEVKQSMVVTEDTKVIEPARIADEFLVFVTFMVSFALRFFRLDWPNGVVFDETHFGRFTNQYHAGTFLFDIHPPLGKLLFYWVTKLFNYDYRECGYQEIHDLYSEDCKFMILRGTAATFGLVTPVLLYYVIRNFSGGKWAAFLGATLMNFDMLNLMESRFILMDSQLMFWATASLLVAQKWWKRMNQHSLAQEELNVIRLLRSKLGIRSPRTTGITKEKIPKEEKYLLKWQIYATSQMMPIWTRIMYLLWVAITCSSAVSIKWTALVTPAMVAIVSFFGLKPLRRAIPLKDLLFIAFVVVFHYVLWFVFHFHLLPYSGDGDTFMTREFQKTLIGSPDYDSLATRDNMLSLIINLNIDMFTANAGITARHDWESLWWEWPLNLRGLLYYVHKNAENTDEGLIYLLGNPLVIWPVSLVVFITCLYFVGNVLRTVSQFLAGDGDLADVDADESARYKLMALRDSKPNELANALRNAGTLGTKLNSQKDVDELLGKILREKERHYSNLSVANILYRKTIHYECPYQQFETHLPTVEYYLSQIIHANNKNPSTDMSKAVSSRYSGNVQTLYSVLSFCIVSYWLNLLPYIAVDRSAFIYHYMPALAYGEIIFALILEQCVHEAYSYVTDYIRLRRLKLLKKLDPVVDDADDATDDDTSTAVSELVSAVEDDETQALQKERWTGFAVLFFILMLVVPCFVYFSPLVYGFVLTQDQLQARRWLPRWN